MSDFISTFEYKLIYVFRINDEAHKGLLKIGDATVHSSGDVLSLINNCKELNQAAKARINSYTQTAGVQYELLHTELAVHSVKEKGITKVKAFRDKAVHSVLLRSGIKKHAFDTEAKGTEWFHVDLETVKNAIAAVKKGQSSLTSDKITDEFAPIDFRPEQEKAIKDTITQFKKSDRMLWNAKMRFGKTLCALEVAKRNGYKKTLIYTHRPVVGDGWFEDFEKLFYGTEYKFGSKMQGESIENLIDKETPFVYFASMQDLRGSAAVGGKFEKNEYIFLVDWDYVVVDEAHEGTKTTLGERVKEAILSADPHKIPKMLELSGTPFNLLSDYKENEIYTWDYIMEQRAKCEWENLHGGDSNPYEDLPQMQIFTYNLEKSFAGYVDVEDSAFNFREFFRTWTGNVAKDFKVMPSNEKIGDFVHENDVNAFLNLLSKKDDRTNYPFSTDGYRSYFRHTLWMLPGVKEAKALSNLLNNHPVFGNFTIVNVAGDGDEEVDTDDALKAVHNAISENADETYSITLSCGRLTTGVSVREWTAVMMLAGSFNTSASAYLQTIFRVQTPANINGKTKERCAVFDFAPDRTLKMVAEAGQLSTRAGSTSSDKAVMGEFLNYCPVIAIDGSDMKPYNVDSLLQQLKRAYTDRVVKNGFDDKHIYNDNLLKLDDIELSDFEKLKGIIGSSKQSEKAKDIDLNSQGFTDEEYAEIERVEKKSKKERTPEEIAFLKEKKNKRDNAEKAMSILRGISIRIPLLMYGAEVAPHKNITCKEFVDLTDDSSWNEFMPKGVTKDIYKKFVKYYDADIFVAAGKQIRSTALAADSLSPTERVIKIASLFTTFKNPDKETVLTPWRVVNMHMSDCLGGYDFYDEKHEDALDEPRFVDRGKVTADTFANVNAKILEINSKTGLYPLYVTYSIYRKKLEAVPEKERTYEKQYALWIETVEKNLFVICKTPMAKAITKRTLLGYRNGKINAHAFDDLINQLKEKPEQFRDKITRGSFWNREEKEMKFDAIVGNPPYQAENKGDGNGSDPVYHLFIDCARSVCDKGTFIHPARFLFNAGKTPKEWNKKILNDEHFKVIDYWANSSNVFPMVDVKGGIAITLWDSKQNFKKIGIFSAYSELRSIIDKVLKENFITFANLVYQRDLYHLTEKLYEENKWAENRQSKGHRYDVGSNVFEIFPELFTDDKPKGNNEYAQIYGRSTKGRKIKWVKKDYLKTPDNFNNYKVFVPKANGSGAIGEVLSTPLIGQPLIGHTVTFLSIGKFDSIGEASSLLKYIKTKFARTMLGTLKATQDNPRETWLNVPLQDFTDNSDIDWSKPIPEIDKQLYAKYNLTSDEISFIESMIKPME